MTTDRKFESTDDLSDGCKQALRGLMLACADTKLLLGYHYGEWTFGPPEIEAAIACCSLCQAELGHVRLFHGLLNKHYGVDPDELVEVRKASEFANLSFLDNEITDWAELVAANYVVDLAVTALLFSMQASSFQPLHMSLGKMLQEEKYHIHHGQGWFRALAQKSDETRKVLTGHTRTAIRSVVEWFGPDNADADHELVAAGIKAESNAATLSRVLTEIGNFAEEFGVDLGLTRSDDATWQYATTIDWNGWQPQTRRIGETAPDEQILYHLRGSKNKVFKLG